jgi:hypothetical protein
MTADPSPGAHVIARLLPVLSDQTRHQLRAMLADEIATREALAPANHSLVGIAALVSAHGRVPSIAEYEEGRRSHPDWPHHNTLGRHYGTWLHAVSAAAKLISPIPTRARPRTAPMSPTRYDMIQAIVRCRLAVGDWPTGHEYARWRNVEADICRRTGAMDLIAPEPQLIRRRLGTWNAALDIARHQAQTAADRAGRS